MSSTGRTERRLAAILAADIVGYSRLVEQDEADTLAAIRELRARVIDPLLAEHQGRIVKFMGDGAIVEFGSVVDAVACAVAVQKAVAEHQAGTPADRRIVFRIGINLGDVVVEGDDLLGDGVNVAARLEQLCEPSGVLVSGTAFDQLQGKLGLPLEFTGEQKVKNIERPVRAYRVRLDGKAARRRSLMPRSRRFRAAAVALLLAAAVVGAGARWLLRPDTVAAHPSIAVLPFNNLSGDQVTGRLALGIAEDIITDLARFRSVDVIARNSTEVYDGKAVDVRQLGKDLKVAYVLGGSIQRDGDRFRITAQLIDARTHLWAERWDRPATELFAVQTEVAERAVNSLDRRIANSGEAAALRRRTTDLVAYELVLLSTALRLGPRADVDRAMAYVDEAISKDPAFARAYVSKAWTLWNLARFEGRYAEAFAAMERMARTAIALDPYDAYAHITLAFATSSLGRSAEALAATEGALELAPSYADILNRAADILPFDGFPDRALELCDRSFRLNPGAPSWYHLNCVTARFLAGRHQAVIYGQNQFQGDLNTFQLIWRTASLAELGRGQDAAATVETLRQKYPNASYEYMLNNGLTFAREEDQAKTLAGIRKAGIRLCASADELAGIASPRRLPECDAERAKMAAPRT